MNNKKLEAMDRAGEVVATPDLARAPAPSLDDCGLTFDELGLLARAYGDGNQEKTSLIVLNADRLRAARLAVPDVDGLTDAQIEAKFAAAYYPPKEPGNELLQRVYPGDLVKVARSLLATKAAAQAAPQKAVSEGAKLMPPTLTDEMRHAFNGVNNSLDYSEVDQIYKSLYLTAPVPPVSAPAEQGDDESLFWPPKALLKREDWDPLTRKPKAPAEQPSPPVPRVGGNTSVRNDAGFRAAAVMYLRAKASERAEAFESLVKAADLAHVARQPAAATAERAAINELLTRIDDANENYERFGQVCEFEGQPMIYASTLHEIIELRGKVHVASLATPSSTEASAQAAPVAVVDAGDDGLFVEILFGPNGSELKCGDKLYLGAQAAPADLRDAARWRAFRDTIDLDSVSDRSTRLRVFTKVAVAADVFTKSPLVQNDYLDAFADALRSTSTAAQAATDSENGGDHAE